MAAMQKVTRAMSAIVLDAVDGEAEGARRRGDCVDGEWETVGRSEKRVLMVECVTTRPPSSSSSV